MKRNCKLTNFAPIARRGLALTVLPAAVLSVAAATYAQSTSPGSSAQKKLVVAEEYGRLPLSFEKNEGQAATSVKFLTHGPGYSLYLTRDGALLLPQKGPDSKAPLESEDRPRIRLLGANPNPEIVGLEELPGKVNYLLGNDPTKWRTNLPTFARVLYKNVYPGIDLAFYGNHGTLEFDFIVHPGANPNSIQLEGVGRRTYALDRSGNIHYDFAGGRVILRRPFSYVAEGAERREVASNYVLERNGRVSFQVKKYDASKDLVIDPALGYSTFLGGNTATVLPAAVAVDAKGEAIVAGLAGTTYPMSPGSFESAAPPAGEQYVPFVMKLNAAGTAVVYATFLGGIEPGPVYSVYPDAVTSVAADAQGNAYLTGRANSLNFPTTANVFQSTSPCLAANQKNGLCTHSVAFVTELNPTGSGLVFSTFLGGTTTPTYGGVMPYAAQGRSPIDVVHSYVVTGQPGELGTGIAVDSTGVYVGGITSSLDFPVTPGAAANTFNNYSGASVPFLAKLAGGSLIYATYLFAVPSNQQVLTTTDGFAIDPSGNAYISGTTWSNFPTTPGAYQPSFGSYPTTNPSDQVEDCSYVAKMNPSGSALVYATLFACTANSTSGWQVVQALSVAADAAGNAYITGSAWNNGSGNPSTTTLPTTGGALQTSCPLSIVPPATPACGASAFVTEINPTGTGLVYSTYLGANKANTSAYNIAVNSSGEAVVTGDTITLGASAFPTTPDAVQTSCLLYGGDCDAGFVSELSADGSSLVYSTFLSGSMGGSGAFAVALDTPGNIYAVGVTQAKDFPTSSGAFDTNLTQTTGGFLVKVGNAAPGSVSVQPSTAPAGAVGIFYGPVNFTQTGGTGSVTWAETGLPTGSGLTFVNGVLQGTPTVSGTFTVTVTATDSVGNQGSVTFSLVIYAATSASISALPCGSTSTPITTFDFGSVPVGSSSTQDICVNNTGTSTLYFSYSTLLPATTWFSVTSETCDILQSTPPSLTNGIAPGASCTVTMQFSPTAVGPASSVLLSFVDNAGSQSVSITGTGLARTTAILSVASAGSCSVSAANITTLNFGSVSIGTTVSQTVCITNTGSNPLYITAISPPIVHPFSPGLNSCPFLTGAPTASNGIPPGGSCQLVISFTPTVPGTSSGIGFQVVDNAGTQALNLTGTGVAAPSSADLAVINTVTTPAPPGTVAPGGTITFQAVITNNGPAASDATFTEPIPTNTTFSSLTNVNPADPTAWNCTALPAGQTGTVSCTTSALAANASSAFNLVVTVNSGAAAVTQISATATVSAATTTDPNTANNSSTATATVGQSSGGAPPCACNKTGNYVNPNQGSAPATGSSSPNGKYTLTAIGSPITLTVQKNGTTLLTYSFSSSSNAPAWGFSPDDDRFVIIDVSGSTGTGYIYNLAGGNPGSAVKQFPVSADSSLLSFSPSGRFLMFTGISASILPTTSVTIQVYNVLTAHKVYENDFTLTATLQSAQGAFAAGGWGFSPDSPETSFVYAFLTGQNSTQLELVHLVQPPNADTYGSANTVSLTSITSAFWQFSPCGDALGVVTQPSSSSSFAEIDFYRTIDGTQLEDFSGVPVGNITMAATAATASTPAQQVATDVSSSGTQTYSVDDSLWGLGCYEQNMPVGQRIIVQPLATGSAPSGTLSDPVTLTFPSVDAPGGQVSLALSDSGAAPPTGSQSGTPSVYYDLSVSPSSLSYGAPIAICINYAGVTFSGQPQLFHIVNGTPANITTSVDTANQIACGSTPSFSPFGIFSASGPVSTVTTVTSSAGASVVGQAITLTAEVVPSLVGSPTGTITFSDGSMVLGTVRLGNTGAASFTTTQLGAGSHSITATYAGDSYFQGSASSALALSVTPAPLTVTAYNYARLYGAADPAFTATYNGFVNGDGPGALSGTLMCSAGDTPSTPVGMYAINCSAQSSPNYTITYVPGTLTITPAPLTIAAANAARPYGASNPVFTGVITGLQNADPISASFSTTALSASPVGTYAITPVVSDPQNRLGSYTLNLVNGTLSVLPEATSVTLTFSPLSIPVGQSTTVTLTLTAPDMVIAIPLTDLNNQSLLTPITVTSPAASDILSNNGVCTPVPSTTPGTASCTITVTSVEPNGRTLNASFGGSPDLAASSGSGHLIVTAALNSQQVCIASDFRNVAVPGGGTIWFNSIFKVHDVTKQLIHVTFYQSSAQFQYQDATGSLVTVNQALPDAKITIDPNATTASTSFDTVNNVWVTTIPFDLDDNSFLTGMPWVAPSAGLPADVEPVTLCGTFASDVASVDVGWRWAAAAYSTFGTNATLGVKPMDTDKDNPGSNDDRAGTPENYKQYLIPGARGKGGRNYTGSYSRDLNIE